LCRGLVSRAAVSHLPTPGHILKPHDQILRIIAESMAKQIDTSHMRGLRVQSRGTAYSGSWITRWSWLREIAHPRLPKSNPVGVAYTGIMPLRTMLNLLLEDPRSQSDILSGMVAGWVQHPATHTVQFRYGKGRVIMTTFRLRATLGFDPTGTTMLHDLVEYLRSDRCRPTLTANY
jgi:hypothetical protein